MQTQAIKLIVIVVVICAGCDALSEPFGAPAGSSNRLTLQDLAFSLHLKVPVQCIDVRKDATLSILKGIHIDLKKILPSSRVQFSGCRNSVSGPYITYSISANASKIMAKKAKTTLLQFDAPATNKVFCDTFPMTCASYTKNFFAAVSNVLIEAVAPGTTFQTTIPLGWTGFSGSQKMLLPVLMGSQNQSFSVVLDTGSTVPYVVGYNWKESTTFVNTTEPGLIEYGGAGNVTGFYGVDTATVGGITDSTFKFLVRTGDSGSDGSGGGLFGFAVGGYALPGQAAPDVVSSWKQLSAAAGLNGTKNDMVGLWLSNDQKLLQDKTDLGGELDVGALNTNRYTGNPVWLPVVPANSSVRTLAVNGQLTWWLFTVARMAIEYADGSSQTICEDCNTIADSGWPNVVITPRDAGELAIASMTGAAPAHGCAFKLLVDCGAAGQLRMNLTRDGKPPVANCATNYPATGDEKVFTNFRVAGLADGVDNWYVLGLPFLRQLYTVFDYNTLKLGFYNSVQNY